MATNGFAHPKHSNDAEPFLQHEGTYSTQIIHFIDTNLVLVFHNAKELGHD
jgi:hypothetical protein